MLQEFKDLFKHIENRTPTNKHFYMIWLENPLQYELYCDLETMECRLNLKKSPHLKDTFHISEAVDKLNEKELLTPSLMGRLEKHIFAPLLYREVLMTQLKEIMPDFENRYENFASFYRSLPKVVSETLQQDKRNKLSVIKED